MAKQDIEENKIYYSPKGGYFYKIDQGWKRHITVYVSNPNGGGYYPVASDSTNDGVEVPKIITDIINNPNTSYGFPWGQVVILHGYIDLIKTNEGAVSMFGYEYIDILQEFKKNICKNT